MAGLNRVFQSEMARRLLPPIGLRRLPPPENGSYSPSSTSIASPPTNNMKKLVKDTDKEEEDEYKARDSSSHPTNPNRRRPLEEGKLIVVAAKARDPSLISSELGRGALIPSSLVIVSNYRRCWRRVSFCLENRGEKLRGKTVEAHHSHWKKKLELGCRRLLVSVAGGAPQILKEEMFEKKYHSQNNKNIWNKKKH